MYLDNLNLDVFSYLRMKIETATIGYTWLWAYPSLYCLHSDLENPPITNLSSEGLEVSGVYLLNTGLELIVWIGKSYIRGGKLNSKF